VERQNEFGFAAGVGKLSINESSRDGQKMIGDTLHSGDDHGDMRRQRSGANETRGVEHAIGTEKRGAAELESDDVSGLLEDPAGADVRSIDGRPRGVSFRC
jgi:hypothetical protein